jgi:hypothetical protein
VAVVLMVDVLVEEVEVELEVELVVSVGRLGRLVGRVRVREVVDGIDDELMKVELEKAVLKKDRVLVVLGFDDTGTLTELDASGVAIADWISLIAEVTMPSI